MAWCKILRWPQRWYTMAAEKGHASAQNNLGVMFERGKGVPVDLVKAAEWYRKAAEKNNPSAQNNLGVLYGKGLGVKADLVTANYWFSRAALGGSVNAVTNRDSTGRKLTPQQRQEVARLLATPPAKKSP